MQDGWPDLDGAFATSFLSASDLVVRLGVAAACGALLGIDRELRHKTLGLRTYMLVSLGAASFTIMIVEMVHVFTADHLRLDPTRIVEGVIGGIGFLGAGAIIQQRGELRGATTGAGIWMVGAVGMVAGFGFCVHTLIMTGFAVLVITVLGAVTGWLRADEPREREAPTRPVTPR
jgi:putative Mg2+ transporter-C (MgtC) family protein